MQKKSGDGGVQRLMAKSLGLHTKDIKTSQIVFQMRKEQATPAANYKYLASTHYQESFPGI